MGTIAKALQKRKTELAGLTKTKPESPPGPRPEARAFVMLSATINNPETFGQSLIEEKVHVVGGAERPNPASKWCS